MLWAPLFVTLTCPGGTPAHWVPYARRLKRDLETFLKRFWRLEKWGWGPGAFVIWKLEPQERGAPHIHLLMFNVPYLEHETVARWWHEIVGSGDVDHLRAGTQVEGTRTWARAGYYISKYMGKGTGAFISEKYRGAYTAEETAAVLDLWRNPGRFWGVRHREHMPLRLEVWAMSRSAFYQLRRIARGVAKAQSRGRYRLRMQNSFTAFLGDYSALGALSFVGAWRL